VKAPPPNYSRAGLLQNHYKVLVTYPYP